MALLVRHSEFTMSPVLLNPADREYEDIFFDVAGITDYTLNNPDTLTKYKTAAQISHKVLEAVTGRYCSSEGSKLGI